jgi:hypothetical protein
MALAARAADYDLGQWSDYFQGYHSPSFGWDCWNPLTDDGDALILAIDLDIIVQRRAASFSDYTNDDVTTISIKDGLVMGATRRAIVCAAAEIGSQCK